MVIVDLIFARYDIFIAYMFVILLFFSLMAYAIYQRQYNQIEYDANYSRWDILDPHNIRNLLNSRRPTV